MNAAEHEYPLGIVEVAKLLGVFPTQITRLIDAGFITPPRNSSRRNQEAYSFSEDDFLLLQRIFLVMSQGVPPRIAAGIIQSEIKLESKIEAVASAIELLQSTQANSSISLLIEQIANLYEVHRDREIVRETLRRELLNRD